MGLSREPVLAGLPAGLRESAARVLDWLLPDDEDLDALAAYDVLHFVWYQLPVRWGAVAGERGEVTAAVAALMDAAGRPRVAGLVRDQRTVLVQAGWRSDRRGAVRRYEQAMADSGYAPPDTDLVAWGTVSGVEEAAVHRQLAVVLEKAVDAGVVVPGRAGWRSRQANLAEAWLTTPSISFRGQPPIAVVNTERRRIWWRTRHVAAREVLTPILPLLDGDTTPPDADAAPLRWLCEQLRGGVTLTQAGYLPTGLVAEAKQRWYGDWVLPGVAARSESDLPPLMGLRGFAHTAGLLTRRGGRLTLSRAGQQTIADPDRWWRTVTQTWFGDGGMATEVAEVAAGLLLQDACTARQLTARAADAVLGRYLHRDGSPAGIGDVSDALYGWLRPGNCLGFIDYGTGLVPANRLTEAGRAAAITGLRGRARAPVTRPG